jgi:hypothetical protein
VAKYLRIDPDRDPQSDALTGVNYRLPADTDLTGLLAVLQETLRDGGSLTVTVEMSDDPLNRAFVVINGSTVRHVLVSETPEPD